MEPFGEFGSLPALFVDLMMAFMCLLEGRVSATHLRRLYIKIDVYMDIYHI